VIRANSLKAGFRDNALILDLPAYKKVSSIHAVLSAKTSSNIDSWQIQDLSSKNGTYVNGEKITPNYRRILKNGDRIILGSSTGGDKYPEFIFECAEKDAKSSPNSNIELSSYGLILLVIEPEYLLKESLKRLISYLMKSSQSYLTILVSLEEEDELETHDIKKKLNSIHNWIKEEFQSLSFQTRLLNFSYFHSGSDDFSISPSQKRKYDKFCKDTENHVKSQLAQIITHQVGARINDQINFLHQHLNEQEIKIQNNLNRVKEKLSNRDFDDLQHELRRVSRTVSDDKEHFIHSIRDQLRRDLNGIISDNRPEGFPRKLKKYVYELNILFTKQNKEIIAQLTVNPNQDMHSEIISFCRQELKQWADNQWQKVLYSYSNGGIFALRERTASNFSFLPSIDLEDEFNSNFTMPDFQRTLEVAFLEMQDYSASYYEENALVKNFIQVGFEGGIAVGMSFLNPSMAILSGIRVASSLVGRVLSISNNRALKEKRLHNICDQLRQRTYIYYQRLSRSIADEINQDIMNALVFEERLIRRSIESTNEKIMLYLSEMQKATVLYSSQLNEVRNKKKSLLSYNLSQI
jgi:hypothetical protein